MWSYEKRKGSEYVDYYYDKKIKFCYHLATYEHLLDVKHEENIKQFELEIQQGS